MTLTPERIAEIEATIALRPNDVHVVVTELLTEMCRLARLGMRVEEAPTCVIGDFDDAAGLSALARTVYFANGKRVALVVTDE